MRQSRRRAKRFSTSLRAVNTNKASTVTLSASTNWCSATAMPMALTSRIEAAVVNPSIGPLLAWKIVPAPRKLMPVMIAPTCAWARCVTHSRRLR